MKFGFSLFGLAPHQYAEVAQVAESRGFESVWIPEHIVFPAEMPPTYPYSEDGLPPVRPGSPLYDPWVTLAYIAAATKRLRLGTHVYILPLRHPLITARTFTTLDVISGGRAILGAGVGWLADEFAYMGIPFRERGVRTDEILQVLRRLWTERVVHHQGRFYEFGPLRFEPKPVQKPHPPIELGGVSPPALRRVARHADGWLAVGTHGLDDLKGRIAELARLREEAGRSQQPFEISAGLGGPIELDAVRRHRDAGVTRLLLRPGLEPGRRPDVASYRAFLERCGDEVLSRLGGG